MILLVSGGTDRDAVRMPLALRSLGWLAAGIMAVATASHPGSSLLA